MLHQQAAHRTTVWNGLGWGLALGLVTLGNICEASTLTSLTGRVLLQGQSSHAGTVIELAPLSPSLQAPIGWLQAAIALTLAVGWLLLLRRPSARRYLPLLALASLSSLALALPRLSIILSNGAGDYAFTNSIPEGSYRIELRHEGYQPTHLTLETSLVTGASFQLPTITLLPLTQTPGEHSPPPPPGLPDLDPTQPSDPSSVLPELLPYQPGLDPHALDPSQVSVVRGQVLNSAGQPLPSVEVSVLDWPSLGHTLTRADGAFDLLVQGGNHLTLSFLKPGWIPSQRTLDVPRLDFSVLGPVHLLAYDPVVTTIDMGASSMQVARGSPISDLSGSRQATLFFPPATRAHVRLATGRGRELEQLHVRATEFTVGPNGPSSMPADLPANSGYTYAVELSADEADPSRGEGVDFEAPVWLVLENFLNLPVGGAVPVGFYDRLLGKWVASKNGRVIQVLGLSGGLAQLDVDGDGLADSGAKLEALGLTDPELAQLGTLYATGQSLWRVSIGHFTPWDCNWPFGPPDDATPPDGQPPCEESEPQAPCKEGCDPTLEPQTGALLEAVDVPGTGCSLHYRSNRQKGYLRPLRIPLSGSSVPGSLKRIELELSIAGRLFQQSFQPVANLNHSFVWDGLDAYGRRMQGAQRAVARVGFVYDGVYRTPVFGDESFGKDGGVEITGSQTRQEVTLWKSSTSLMGQLRPQVQGLGGWTLDVLHEYDPVSGILHMGNGSSQHLELGLSVVAGKPPESRQVPGDGEPAVGTVIGPVGVALDAGGTLHIVDFSHSAIRKVDAFGRISTVAGTGQECPDGSGPDQIGDGGPATEACLNQPVDMDFGADGSMYIAEFEGRIRKVGLDGRISTVVGKGPAPGCLCQLGCPNGDGGPATEAVLSTPRSVAVASDGSLYIAELDNIVRKVGLDGRISTVAGLCLGGSTNEGIPATQAALGLPWDLDVGPDGSLYIAEYGAQEGRVRRVGLDGLIRTVAGGGTLSGLANGVAATTAKLKGPQGLFVDEDGTLYIADTLQHAIRRVDGSGRISTVVGLGVAGFEPGQPLTPQTPLHTPVGVAVSSGKRLYIAEQGNGLVRAMGLGALDLSSTERLLPSWDGSEVYVFDQDWKHRRTHDALTGALLAEMSYDAAGRFLAVKDLDQNEVRLERGALGEPVALVGVQGSEHRTQLGLDVEGNLAHLIDPLEQVYRFVYEPGSLLDEVEGPDGAKRTVSYDEEGRAETLIDEAGATKSLTRSGQCANVQVTTTSPEGRQRDILTEKLPTGEEHWTETGPDGLETQIVRWPDLSQDVHKSNLTISQRRAVADPRFAKLAPLWSGSLTVPSGLTLAVERKRSMELVDLLRVEHLVDETRVNGRLYSSEYEGATRHWTHRTPQGRKSHAWLDERGRLVQSQVEGLFPVKLAYDARGRLESVEQGLRKTSYAYGPTDLEMTLTDALGRESQLELDAAGQPQAQVLPGGRRVELGHDKRGNLTKVKPPSQPDHAMGYNALSLLKSYEAPELVGVERLTSYAYNLDRQLTKVDRPDGQSLTFQHDATSGRLKTLTLPDGQIQYVYSPTTGQLTSLMARDGGVLSFGFDGDLLTDTTWAGAVSGTIHRVYDNNLRIISQSINGVSPISFGYDLDGLLTSAGSLTLTHDPNNGLLASTTMGSVTDSLLYDGYGEVMSYSAAVGSGGIYSVNYIRDDLGRIKEKTETVLGEAHTEVYAYHEAGWLKDVERDGVNVGHYEYDANGNRLSLTTESGTIMGSHDAQDRLKTYGTLSFSYSENGDLQTKTDTATGKVTSYSYDVLGNLVSVDLPDGRRIEYVLDAANRRVGKKVDGILTQGWLWEGLSIVAELDSNSQVSSRFVPGGLVKGGVTYRIVADHLGSPRLVVNASTGEVVQRMDFDEFGNVLVDTNPGFQPMGFAGGLWDPDTGLVRFGARDHDATIGRWLSKDPIRFNGGDTNLYGYCLLDPINFVDPSGLYSFDEFLGDTADFSAGFGDMISFGITDQVRELMGTNDVVNKCSWTYTAGEVAGFAHTVAMGWAAGTKAAAKAASANDWANFSHSAIPSKTLKSIAKSNGDNWIGSGAKWLNRTGNRLNGDFISPELHTMIDASAQFGLDRAWLEANPLFPAWRQAINRIPYVPGAVAYGAGSYAMNAGECGCN